MLVLLCSANLSAYFVGKKTETRSVQTHLHTPSHFQTNKQLKAIFFIYIAAIFLSLFLR